LCGLRFKHLRFSRPSVPSPPTPPTSQSPVSQSSSSAHRPGWLSRAAHSQVTLAGAHPSKHAARPGRATPKRRRGARRRAGENLRCMKRRERSIGRAAKPHHHVFAGPPPSPLPKARDQPAVTTAACVRWRTPRLSGHPRRAPRRCRRPERCRLCRLRDLRGSRWRCVPDRLRSDRDHGRCGSSR
jgi:hypothetical protein